MRGLRTAIKGLLVATILVWAGGAGAGLTPAQKCEALKNKEAGKYSFCRQKAEMKLVKTGDPVKYADALTKCTTKYSAKWQALEAKAVADGGACPSVGDEVSIQSFVTAHTTDVAAALSGSGLPAPPCSTFPATGQTTSYKAADDGALQAGATLLYVDNGDGTVTDSNTGLIWAKKSDDGSIHDQDNLYTWDDAFDVYVATLNSGSFAGQTDWRLPNAKELQSIVNYEQSAPSADWAFNSGCVASCAVTACSCTRPSFYWTSTTLRSGTSSAWLVNFFSGTVTTDTKVFNAYARAVRGP